MSVTPEQLRATAETYVAGLNEKDLEKIMGLYAENSRVEDPVGSETVHDGIDEVRAFYESVTGLDNTVELKEVRALGREVLFRFVITTKFDENTSTSIDVWDLMEHDDSGKVVSMKAYWGPENMS